MYKILSEKYYKIPIYINDGLIFIILKPNITELLEGNISLTHIKQKQNKNHQEYVEYNDSIIFFYLKNTF